MTRPRRRATLVGMAFELAQVNVARFAAPLDAPALADFVAGLDPVNAAADRADGFVWRLQAEDGNATSIQAFAWDAADSCGVITNMSVWTDVERLTEFVFGEMHRQVLRRRREWFAPMRVSVTCARTGRPRMPSPCASTTRRRTPGRHARRAVARRCLAGCDQPAVDDWPHQSSCHAIMR